MGRAKRMERVVALTKILVDHPQHLFSFSYFCKKFEVAKSTLSEDVVAVKNGLELFGLGKVETLAGAAGGVRFIPGHKAEDDNEFSPNFLEYMNYNLEKYADDDSIYAICGYHYPIKWNDIPQDRIYASFFYSPWGAGFWINKYKSATIEEIDLYLHSMSNIVKMAKHVPFLLNTVIGMRYSNYKYGDAIIRTRLFLENKACIFPTLTKVRNCGYDNTGVNCRDDGGVHAKQKIDDNFDYISDEIIEIPDLLHRYNEYYCVTFVDKLKSLIKYFCYLCKHTMRNLQESYDTDVKNG